MKRTLLSIILLVALLPGAKAQATYNEKVLSYIEKYKDWAMLEQVRSGVPASITLAQGILETAAGESELCSNANNHFGIKCKKTWNGQTYTYTDDAKDECFRKYDSAYQSYMDHSDFLRTNPRYATLFFYSPIDYKSWAHGLKKCGYATNPQYAVKLIKFIEDYGLAEYTVIAMNSTDNNNRKMLAEKEEKTKQKETKVEVLDAGFENLGYAQLGDSAFDKNAVEEYYLPSQKNDLKGFYARKGDLLLEYAIKSKTRYSKLLIWNDLPDQPLQENMFIYTESKRKKALKPTHTLENGETLHSVSQEEGIQLAQLLLLNNLSEQDQPAIGSILNLQVPNTKQIELISQSNSVAPAPIVKRTSSESEDDFIVREKKNNVAVEEPKEETLTAIDNEENPTTANIQESLPTTVSEDEENDETAINKNGAGKKQIEQQEPDNQEALSPLERLKAYMDNTVYANETKESASPKKQTESVSVSKPTLPAAKQNTKIETVAPKASTANSAFHVVKKGDTAFSISKQYNISLAQLRDLNRLPSSMVVSVGQKLRVK